MKKFSLLLCCFVALLVSQRVYADDGITVNGTVITITSSSSAGNVSGWLSAYLSANYSTDEQKNTWKASITKIIFDGKFNSSDLDIIASNAGFNSVTTVNMTDAEFYKGNDNTSYSFKLFASGASGTANLYSKAIENAHLFQSTSVKDWQELYSAPGEGNAEIVSGGTESVTSPYVGQKIACPTGNYKYCQLVVTPSGWTGPRVGAPNISGYTVQNWDENNLSNYINDVCNKAEIYRYYKIVDGNPRSWQQCTVTDWNNAETDNDAETLNFIAGQGDAVEATIDNLADHVWFKTGTCIRFSIYYDKVFNRSWTGDTDAEQTGAVDASFDYSYRDNHLSDYSDRTSSVWVKMPRYTYHEYQSGNSLTWEELTFENGSEWYNISQHLQGDNANNLSGPWAEGQFAVVSTNGTSDVKTYNGNEWASDVTQVYDYDAIRFNRWKNTLTTAYLPSYVDPASCPSSLLNECTYLTTLYSGTTFAQRTDETTEGVTTVTVQATAPNLFKLLLDAKSTSKYSTGTIFKFTSNSVICADDLLAFVGDENKKYYVDLFDIDASATGATIESVLESAIETLRFRDRQFIGLLLPKNPGSIGTRLIQDAEQNSSATATCSDFIAYYKVENSFATTTMHLYDAYPENYRDASTSVYRSKLQKLVDIMNSHKDNSDNSIIANTTNAYLVTSNSEIRIANVTDLLQTATPSKTIIETINNEMVKATDKKPSVYATLITAGDFNNVVAKTSIGNTPNVDVLQITGPVNAADITAVNMFKKKTSDDPLTYDAPTGPSVLDLKNVTTGVTKAMLNDLTNTAIEYIVLRGGMTAKDITDADYSDLTSLKTVISSNSTNLVAYVKVAGSLAKARCLATGNDENNLPDNTYYPNKNPFPSTKGLTTVTLAGKLYACDIATSSQPDGLYHENQTIQMMDLEKAVFYQKDVTEYINGEWVTHDVPNSKEMKFYPGYAQSGSIVLREVKLPAHKSMTTIASECFKNITSLTDVCIPYSYTHILSEAFNDSGVNHITTTDENGVEIDNGPLTYTLSANVKQLGTKGVEFRTFPQNVGVKEVYCLATKVPVCYKDVFPDNFTFGFGGLDQDMVYCREKYHNPNEGGTGDQTGSYGQMIGVLRFPSLESFNNITDTDSKESSYEEMVKKYTDPYRVYTKKDQTGAVDANGDPLLWPTRTEMNEAKGMADDGNIWTDYTYTHSGTNLEEIGKVAKGTLSSEHYDFSDYIGWHQIVLTQATYVDKPEDKNSEDKIVRNYVDAGWFTFCIPFNMTYRQVVEMMGIPASSENVKNYKNATKSTVNGVTTYSGTPIGADEMPDIRQLKSVIRVAGQNGANNVINFRLTPNLAVSGNKTAQYLDFSTNGNLTTKSTKYASTGTTTAPTTDQINDDAICLIGGRPYYIHAYVLASEVDAIGGNLGMFIMKRYGDKFSQTASCVNSNDVAYYEQLETFTLDNSNNVIKGTDQTTMRFAKPYENHKVQAYLDSDDEKNPGGQLQFTEKRNGSDVTHNYYYTMVGQFWTQKLPLYCVYFSPGSQKWYRYAKDYNFDWDPYKCVIMATPEVTQTSDLGTTETARQNVIETSMGVKEELTQKEQDAGLQKFTTLPTSYIFNHFGGGFRQISNCYFPMNFKGSYDLIHAPVKLCFFGRNDYSFDNQTVATSRYILSLDDNDDILDYGNNATSVKAIDMLNGEQQYNSDSRVYNMSGQYLGNSVEGLRKGIYIIGGRKVVID